MLRPSIKLLLKSTRYNVSIHRPLSTRYHPTPRKLLKCASPTDNATSPRTGLRHIFLSGGGAMYLNDALACEKRLTPIPCHHEQACGIAAEAYGRTGHPDNPGFGVALVTTGPGATNIITPITRSLINFIPLLVISGGVKRADRLAGRPLRQSGVQEVDIIPMVRGITKYAVTLDDPSQVRVHLETALREMRSGRPGPV